jgi:bifunctional lysine-specific demethylase and histidyl-hydroxylase NO66
VIHAAAHAGTSSLHLTIGVLATTAADVVRRVATLAGDVPALRRDLPAGWAADPTVAERVVKEIVAELGAFVSTIDPTEIAEHLAEGFATSRRPLDHGRLLDLERATTLDERSVVVRRDGVRVVSRTPGDPVVLRVLDRSVELPAVLDAAVSTLLDGRQHRVGDLSTWLDEASRLVLVRRLVREGILRIEDQTAGIEMEGSDG